MAQVILLPKLRPFTTNNFTSFLLNRWLCLQLRPKLRPLTTNITLQLCSIDVTFYNECKLTIMFTSSVFVRILWLTVMVCFRQPSYYGPYLLCFLLGKVISHGIFISSSKFNNAVEHYKPSGNLTSTGQNGDKAKFNLFGTVPQKALQAPSPFFPNCSRPLGRSTHENWTQLECGLFANDPQTCYFLRGKNMVKTKVALKSFLTLVLS